MTISMSGLFKLLEKFNHTPQCGLNDKVQTKENVVVKLG
tara:strand:- start:209 stop:325 length:117 start_codon:yes stop_codon:yes gene_type:complete